jgi:hypothetical protein
MMNLYVHKVSPSFKYCTYDNPDDGPLRLNKQVASFLINTVVLDANCEFN